MIPNDDITANYDTLMRQAVPTVMLYVQALKAEMGDAWAEKNPVAFATLVQAAAIDLHGATIGKEIGKLMQAVNDLAPYSGGD